MNALLTDHLVISLGLAQTGPEAEIRQLLANWKHALGERDLERLMSLYSRDVVLFDVQPPFCVEGFEALRELWEQCLSDFPEKIPIDIENLHVEAGEETAFAHWMFRVVSHSGDLPLAQTWMRASAGYRKFHGTWKIVHEHISLPIDPTSNRAVFTPVAGPLAQ